MPYRRPSSHLRTSSDPPSARRRSARLGRGLAAGMLIGLAPGAAWAQGPVNAAATPAASPRGLEIPPPPVEPKTPKDLWFETDFAARNGNFQRAAAYLQKLLASNPDEATLLWIARDERYGLSSLLRLLDRPETKGPAGRLYQMVAEASRADLHDEEKIKQAVDDLTATPEQQANALAVLRRAGTAAVPGIVNRLADPALTPENRALIVRNLGRLGTAAVPPLIAVLDAANPIVAADAADILGNIGDPRALPALTAVASSPIHAARNAAQSAIGRITGRPFGVQPLDAVRQLVEQARRYHRHQVAFPASDVLLWKWSEDEKAPVSEAVSRDVAEERLAEKLLDAALALDPNNLDARVLRASDRLERAVARAGFTNYRADDKEKSFTDAVAQGPVVLSQALREAMADRKTDLAAVLATALGKASDPSMLTAEGSRHALAKALGYNGRRARFAAAKAIVDLEPRQPFAGSSHVVPTLAEFAAAQAAPRAVVIDGNLPRGSQISGFLKELGYEPVIEPTGRDGFRAAAETADVEAVFVDIHSVRGDWRLHDTLANLRNDARTSDLPTYIVGPLSASNDLASIQERFPGVKFMVGPLSSEVFRQQLAFLGVPRPAGAEEREGKAREAADLLARVAAEPANPLRQDMARVETALIFALNAPGRDLSAASALADTPAPTSQRSLADVVIDPARPADLRLRAAERLRRSILRYGPLLAADQEVKIVAILDQEADPAIRNALTAVVAALRPKKAAAAPSTPAVPPAPAPAAATPASPSPEAEPAPAQEPAAPAAAEPAKEDPS